MNIRKKILFNPSHLKSQKPDTSDNTTANTKNSAILDQSKTFRFSKNKVITTRRQRNYIRTITKDQNQKEFTNLSSNAIKRRHFVPSSSTLTSENFAQVKKSIQSKKFMPEKGQLPPLISLKRTQLLTCQKDRKLTNYPSSLHVSSKKQLFNPKQNSKKQPEQAMLNILGINYEEIQKRTNKLNSMNMASFYTTQKSINLSKYSLMSREGTKQNSDKRPQNKAFYNKSQQPDQYVTQKQRIKQFRNDKNQQQLKSNEALTYKVESDEAKSDEQQEQISQEIQVKNDSQVQSKLANQNRKNNQNQWSDTLKSSFRESNDQKNKGNPKNNKTQSSLYESELLQSKQVIQKKNSNNKQSQIHKKPLQSIKNTDSKQKLTNSWDSANQEQKDLEMQGSNRRCLQQSSLCLSYVVQTPSKTENIQSDI